MLLVLGLERPDKINQVYWNEAGHASRLRPARNRIDHLAIPCTYIQLTVCDDVEGHTNKVNNKIELRANVNHMYTYGSGGCL